MTSESLPCAKSSERRTWLALPSGAAASRRSHRARLHRAVARLATATASMARRSSISSSSRRSRAVRYSADAACLRPPGVVLELFLVQSRHICPCLEIELLDRQRTANEAQVDASGPVDGRGRGHDQRFCTVSGLPERPFRLGPGPAYGPAANSWQHLAPQIGRSRTAVQEDQRSPTPRVFVVHCRVEHINRGHVTDLPGAATCYDGCVAGALSQAEHLDGVAAAGFADASVAFTTE